MADSDEIDIDGPTPRRDICAVFSTMPDWTWKEVHDKLPLPSPIFISDFAEPIE